MRNAKQWMGGAALALALTTGCADGAPDGISGPNADMTQAGNPASDVVYDQTDFLGNPLVSEVTIVQANHDAYNRTQPYNPATAGPQTGEFVVGVAGRAAAYARTVAGVLYPDMLVVDASKPASTAGWLSWALAEGYGGRKLSDDVVDVG